MSRRRPRITEEQRSLYKKAKKQGWTVERTHGGHNKWVSPRGQFTIHATSTSDRKSVYNLRSELRKLGLVL